MASSAADVSRSRKPPSADFSTRFLASDGIPTYNALLDSHLGKRREFLLGNQHSLAHLQRTGAIARVEQKAANPSQYVVIMNDPKPSIPSLATAGVASSAAVRRAPTLNHDLYSRGRPPIMKSVSRSESTPQLTSLHQHNSSGRRRRRRQGTDERDEDSEDDEENVRDGAKPLPGLGLGRSASTAVVSAFQPSPSSVIDRLRRRRAAQSELLGSPSRHCTNRSTVERLLASDAAFQLKLQILRDEMTVLTTEKQYFDRQIATMRKRLRGIHAVHENDVAVAHCVAILHARIVKAEEEFMKLVTAQQLVKTDIDTLRRALLAMRTVQKKLTDDITMVEATNAAIADKVRAAKSVRNDLSQELIEWERRAEIEVEEQRLKLPPEEDVVVDANELMSAVQQYRPPLSPLEILQRMLTDKAIVTSATESDKPLLSFRRAFRVIQQTLQTSNHREDNEEEEEENETLPHALDRFVAQFEATEDALLSKHKLNAQLQDEVQHLEKEAVALAQDAAQRHASIRATQHAASTMQQQLHDHFQHTQQRIEALNALRDQRNDEQLRLRSLMQRCLEILHADKLVTTSEAPLHGLLLSELSSPALLEALQQKMTEVAIMLKCQHHAKTVGREGAADQAAETKPTNPQADRRGSVFHARSLKPNAQSVARRSNVLLKRDTGASKIVLGPQEPTGAALTAIRMTAQPPTVDGAQILSEMHAAGMHALHPTIVRAAVVTPQRGLHKAMLTRVHSIRASKRESALLNSGSLRRVSAPVPTTTTGDTTTSTAAEMPSRDVMRWPVRRNTSKGSGNDLTSSSFQSLNLQADDADAKVIENADELDA